MPIFLIQAISLETTLSAWLINIFNMTFVVALLFSGLLIRRVVKEHRRRVPSRYVSTGGSM